ncbi:hypothetical protein AWC21_12265 [Mycolicibacterium peregrinum]|nr:hypothetical protein AWC21_12265 [Mycolicibacterium peregrinum]
MLHVAGDVKCGVRRTRKNKEKNMTDPNENDEQLQRIWTPDPNSRGDVPAGDPFGLYFGKTADDDGPDI